jgi:hypothetical protein
MARCVKCGGEAADPVWAAYADPAFNDKPPAALALHGDCYEPDRHMPLKDAAQAWATRQIERAA